MSITGGLSWVEALEPLRNASSIAAALMLLYEFITIFAILNVVTGALASVACSCSWLLRSVCVCVCGVAGPVPRLMHEGCTWQWGVEIDFEVFCNNAIESAKADKDAWPPAAFLCNAMQCGFRTAPLQEIAIMKQMQWHQSQLRTLKGRFFDVGAVPCARGGIFRELQEVFFERSMPTRRT